MITLVVLGVLIALFILETVLTEIEHFGWATFGLIVAISAAQFFHLVDFLSFVREHTLTTIGYLGLYAVGGIAWSFVKWFSYLRNYRDQFRDYKGKFLTGKNIPATATATVPTDLMPSFKDWFGQNYSWRRGDVNLVGLQNLERPRARQNKSRIVAWASYWPFSFVGTLLNDPVRKFFTWMFNAFSSLYQRMSDYVFRNDLELK